ncbi:MAG: hypothetical protein R3F11_02090 [Verrucomicrobiales bacterium]
MVPIGGKGFEFAVAMNSYDFSALVEDWVSSKKNCRCHGERFSAWSDAPAEVMKGLEVLGALEAPANGRSFEKVQFSGKNYWDTEYPIALSYYPQTEAVVLSCPKCGAIFLSYAEESGHFPQLRLRLVRLHLIV